MNSEGLFDLEVLDEERYIKDQLETTNSIQFLFCRDCNWKGDRYKAQEHVSENKNHEISHCSIKRGWVQINGERKTKIEQTSLIPDNVREVIEKLDLI
ncbi:MAG: hypothetical protein BTN85_1783 [Candidatus Methanohalarchaeum thermophilum]|uniref:Uncharacterized protein n=1 Tax=Methanohalarchaeum thermophilum TaxID=1903181 RepID=A0A1Q6DS40_METT1|nr:MAG: hypothetical protein BTN85_1783 [Candidatus Methanohalarchaeum thermophilum]